jgi:putative selenate reductase FAD-binding subunit
VVGAMARLADVATQLEQNAGRNDPAALLIKAIQQAGPNTFRNAATVGGVIATRPADSELLAALLVLEAELVLERGGAEPLAIPLAEYLSVADRPAGLITEIGLPWQEGEEASERVARTPADYPIVAVTGWRPAGRTIRLAATGLSERPLRLAAAEAALAGGLDDNAIEQASAAAQNSSHHPGDFRGDSVYRAEMAAVLVRRVLRQLV